MFFYLLRLIANHINPCSIVIFICTFIKTVSRMALWTKNYINQKSFVNVALIVYDQTPIDVNILYADE